MAFPTTPTLDNFNRAALGANYSNLAAANGPLAIDGSTRLHGGPADAYTGSYWNVSPYGPDMEAYITYVGSNGLWGSNYGGLWVRLQNGADATPDAYIAAQNSGVLSLVRKVAGSDTPLDTYSWEPDNGEKFGIECIGTAIKVYTDEGAGWVERISVTDGAITGAGYIAIDIYDPGQDDIYLDSLGGGSIALTALPSPRRPRMRSRGTTW